MKRNVKRLIFAAGLSMTFFLGTYIWYHATDSANQSHGDQKPVAYIDRTKDEIQRRPTTRILWQLINTGEPIFSGEAIRTSSLGEVRIQFADSSRFLDVESDSLIIIRQNQGKEISLDLMDGSLMVHQGTGVNENPADDHSLSLNSGGTKMDLSKATASFSKNSNGNLDLQVLSGNIKVDSNGKKSEISSGKSGALGAQGISFRPDSLEILAPALDQAVSLNPEAPEAVQFRWKGFPAQSSVALKLGSSRKNLKVKVETAEGSASLPLFAGTYFWQLAATNPRTQSAVGESPVYRVEVVNRFPPVALAPTLDARLLNSEKGTEFYWTRPEKAESVRLEISKDPNFKVLLSSRLFETEDHHLQKLPDGDYFFRLGAQFPGSKKAIQSKTQKFRLGKDVVEKLAEIKWNSKALSEKQFYSDRPSARLEWSAPERKAENKNKLHFKVKLAKTEEELSVSPVLTETSETKSQTWLDQPGTYLAMIEALNEKNQLIAVSSIQKIEIAPIPLLQAPQIFPAEGDLQASPQGRLDLKWNSVEGATTYEVSLFDLQGKTLRTARFNKNSTTLVNLLPGEMKVLVSSVDSRGRMGEKPQARLLRVPASSGLGVPKLKKVKVK